MRRPVMSGDFPSCHVVLVNIRFNLDTILRVAQVYDLVAQCGGQTLRIPIVETHVRSLNLAVSQGIGLYEAIRQIDAPSLE